MFLSPLALLILAVLVILALPAIWMLCEVALDLPVLGLVLAAACGAATLVMHPHAGPSLVDATLALLAITGSVLLLTAGAGTLRWLGQPRRRRDLPAARLLR
jgi:hypothetical protein